MNFFTNYFLFSLCSPSTSDSRTTRLIICVLKNNSEKSVTFQQFLNYSKLFGKKLLIIEIFRLILKFFAKYFVFEQVVYEIQKSV